MKKIKSTSISKDLQKALDLFPQQVARNKTERLRKQRFAEKIFGNLAREVHRQVHGRKRGSPSGS